MILSCNSCEKKFVVPDNAIGAKGRMVQCSSCGNKWKQFPIKNEIQKKEKVVKIKDFPKKIRSIPKSSKRKIKKKSWPNLYSPEYLAKKHGIRLDSKPILENQKGKDKIKIGFGFYSFVIVSIIITITILRLLYFAQDIIAEKFPILEIYIDYLFESIRNIIDIVNNFFVGY